MYQFLFLVLLLKTTLGGVISDNNATLTCAEYETYTDCISPCVPTCQIPYERTCYWLICYEGCTCNSGYKKDRFNGECIPEPTCQSYCLENQEYRECGSACPPTCQQPDRICEDVCTPGCFCKEGYIFDAFYEQCVETCST